MHAPFFPREVTGDYEGDGAAFIENAHLLMASLDVEPVGSFGGGAGLRLGEVNCATAGIAAAYAIVGSIMLDFERNRLRPVDDTVIPIEDPR